MKKTWIIVGLIAAAFIGLFVWALGENKSRTANYDNYDPNTIIAADDFNGNIADHVKGDKNAPVLLFEYADFQCEACALARTRMETILDEYKGKVALVYRNYLLSYHQNGTAAASAAEAAGLQGYWREYGDLLFKNQNDWYSASVSERNSIFVSYFENVSDGKGDVEKFKSDMSNSAVKKKLDFDQGLAARYIDVTGTPTFYLDGKKVDLSGASGEDGFLNVFREKLDAILKEKGISK
jgi:protein-disulfide isomerase